MVVAPSLSMVKTLEGPMSFSKDAVPAARATGGRGSCTWLHRGWGFVLSYPMYSMLHILIRSGFGPAAAACPRVACDRTAARSRSHLIVTAATNVEA